jgi:sugar lactone lactonase YvrE
MIDVDTLQFVGSNLTRPECVLCVSSGIIYTSDFRGGVSMIKPDGSVEFILADADVFLVQPNGIALLPDGSFLLAHLGPEEGGVYKLTRDGVLTEFLIELNGIPIPPTNFVHLDNYNRIWITVSTRISPRHLAYRSDNADGFIILVDGTGARIVTDNLGYTNECVVHPSGKWLYVNETFARRMSRFEIAMDGSLHNKETVTEFGKGVYPDGLTFLENGEVLVTSIVSNRVVKVDHDGNQDIVLEDFTPSHLNAVEEAFVKCEMARRHLDHAESKVLQNISSLAFGGDDLKTAYLGCLLGDQLACYQSDVPGYPLAHWHFT